MSRDPEQTRKEIMDAAEVLTLDHGFAGASVRSIIERAGVTKGAFFHHFDTKNDLARALVERFAASDRALLDDAVDRAKRYSRDPVQRVMIFVSLLEEELEARPDSQAPACLYASYCYQSALFDEGTMGIARDAMIEWRDRFRSMLEEAAAVRPPGVSVDLGDVADMLTVVVEGAYVMARTLGDPGAVARHFRQYRVYLELLFGLESDGGGRDGE